MAPEWIYLLKVNAGIALFYAFYKLFCQRDTFFQWRRYALLSFLGISLIYPLLNIQDWVKEQPAMYELADYYATWMIEEEGERIGFRGDADDVLSVYPGASSFPSHPADTT